MLKIFLLHVKEGYADRLEHITRMLSSHRLTFELILDGDIPDLSQSILDTYFIGTMHTPSAGSSCAYKHMLCYEKMVREDIDHALVLEDDIFFLSHFSRILQLTLAERGGDKTPWYVGLEATHLKLVPRSQRRKNVATYKSNSVQCTGGYVINKSAAETVLHMLQTTKCDRPIDLFLNDLQEQGIFTLYWTYPPIVEQGSHNGKMHSIIDGNRKSIMRFLKRKIVLTYKICLYYFR